jgi:hypothetical protein
MRVGAVALAVSLSACVAAHGQDAADCEPHPWLKSFDDAPLEVRYCAIQKLHRMASREVIREWSPEAEAASHRCVRAYAEIVLELSGHRKRNTKTLRCDERVRVKEGR